MSNISKYLPSRPLRIGLLILVLGGALVLWGDDLWRLASRVRAPGSSLPEPLAVSDGTIRALKDTDSDGVEDWEELLLGLNPNVRDSDGDGVGDKEESDQRKALLGQDRVAELENLSEGDKIGLQLAADVERSGDEPLSTLVQENTTAYIQSVAKKIKQYSIVDLTFLESNTFEAQQSYFNSMKPILESGDAIEKTDVQKISSVFGQTSTDSFRPMIVRYEATARKLLATPVPPGAESIHLEILNSYYSMVQLLGIVDTEDTTDPVRSYALFSLIQGGIDRIQVAHVAFDQYVFFALDSRLY